MDQDNELLEISGTVDSVIYKNEDNGYTVLRLTDENGETVTVVGTFPYAACGENMLVSGQWMNHAVHGRQFKAAFAQRLMPTDERAIYDYLAGGAVKGVGPATASLLVGRFGSRTLELLENEPETIATARFTSASMPSMKRGFSSRGRNTRRVYIMVKVYMSVRLYSFVGMK